jgi:hypothetical protein
MRLADWKMMLRLGFFWGIFRIFCDGGIHAGFFTFARRSQRRRIVS